MRILSGTFAQVRGLVLAISQRSLLLVLLTPGAAGLRAQEVPEFSPPLHAIERYEHIWEQSPFVVETQVIEDSAGLGKRFSLTGLGSVGKTPVAFLLNKDSLERFSVAEGETTDSGVELVSIELDRDPRQSKATIRLGAEQAAVGYDPASLISTAQAGAGSVPAPMPGVPAPSAPMVNPPAAPAIPSMNNQPVTPPAPPAAPGAQRIIKRRTIQMPK